MSLDLRAKFRSVVEEMLNRWTALRLAVEHGMHVENDGLRTSIELIDYMTDFCINTKKIDCDEIQEALDQIMDQEFDTICDDNSTKGIFCSTLVEIFHFLTCFTLELAINMVKYLTWLREGKDAEIINEINQLPQCEKWIVVGKKINYVKAPDSSSESEGEDMDVEMTPSTSGSTQQVKIDDIPDAEPGWTVVRPKTKRK